MMGLAKKWFVTPLAVLGLLWACSKNISNLPDISNERSVSFGVLMGIPSAAELSKHVEVLRGTKVQWVGLDIPLSRINPREGVYEWDYGNFETTLRTLKAAGLRPVLKFLGQADWLSRDPKGAHADWDATLNLTPPRDREKWQQVVRQVVSRYGTFCDTWQVGNEPDGGGYFRGSADDYMAYLEWTATAIRSVQPRATIVAGELFLGLRPTPGSYGDVLRKLVKRPDLFDVLSAHYPLAPPNHAAPFDDYFRAMKEAGIQKPVWNTEQAASMPCTWLPDGATTHPRTEGGLRLSPIKAFGHSVAEGAEVVLFYSWNYDDSGIFYRPEVLTELRVMGEQLSGAKFVKRIDLGSKDVTLLHFDRDGKPIFVGWTEVKGLEMTLRVQGKDAITLVDWQGNVRRLMPKGGEVSGNLTFCPQFILGTSGKGLRR